MQQKRKMQIEVGAPPVERIRRRNQSYFSYSGLMQVVKDQAGKWVSVPSGEVAGGTPPKKQSAIYQAAARRGITVATTAQGDRVYVRLVPTSMVQMIGDEGEVNLPLGHPDATRLHVE